MYDLAVIGSGGAGFAAAIAARRRGLSVVMIEAGTVGGTCVNTGCVPSKALLAAAEARHVALDAERFPGLDSAPPAVDFGRLIGGKHELVETMRASKYVDLAASYDWEIVHGTARFTGTPDTPELAVDLRDSGTQRVNADQYLIATGSAPWAPPIPGLADAGFDTSTTALGWDRLPETLVVLGGNSIGLEMGQLFARLGTKVTIVEALDRLAPSEEPEISGVLASVFAEQDITVYTSTTPDRVQRDRTGYAATTAGSAGKAVLQAERLLVATGRHPVTIGLDLDIVGVKTGDRGQVVIDQHLRTTNPRIWAAGDVTGDPQFVYIAGAHGPLVVDNAFGRAGRAMDYRNLPRVTFTGPPIASAGLTDAQAIDQGYDCECRVLPLAHVPRAIVNRDTRGVMKLVAERGTGRLLGAHIAAEAAGEVIATAVYALTNRMTTQQIADQWYPYLTMTEALKLTAQSFTRDISLLSCCAH